MNYPNTIDGCEDGSNGEYHRQGSIDRLVIRSPDGTEIKEGSRILIEATIYSRQKHGYTADFYHAADATNPKWIFIGEQSASNEEGLKLLTVQHTLFLPGAMQAIRVNLRRGERIGGISCSGGSRDDADDVIFAVS